MASPFNIFRKNQRAMMAVVGILCMIGFTIGGVTSSLVSRGPVGASDAVVVTTIGGPIHESDLQRMLDARRMANRFMAECTAVAYGQQQAYYVFLMQNMSWEQQFGPDTEESVVQTAILADRAKRMGIVITNRAVEEFLRRRTGDKVTANQYISIVDRMGRGQPEIFDALRTELAAIRLGEIAFSSVEVTPAQRWNYYRRLNQQAEAEVLPVVVADFIDDVSEPADDELRAFFEKHKETEPNPESPEHGFKVSRKAAFRYFVANYEQFVAEADVSDKEIKTFYEENKSKRYRFSEFGDSSDFETEPDTAPPRKSSADEASDSKTAPRDPEPPADSKNEGDSAVEPPTDEAPDAKAPSKPKPQSQSSGRMPESGMQLALYAVQDDEAADAAAGNDTETAEVREEEAAPSKSLEDEKPTSPETIDERIAPEYDTATDDAVTDETRMEEKELSPQADGETQSDEGMPADEPPAERTPKRPTNSKPNAKDVQKDPTPPPISSPLLLIRDIRRGPKPEYDPLWKLEGSIRRELADRKAVAKMNDELQAVQKEFRRYLRNMNDDEDQQSGQLDFTDLAKEHGLKTRGTELLARYELERKYPELAGASLEQENRLAPARRFVDIAYLMPANQSNVLRDLAGNRYLFWKTDEKESYVPTFDEARDDVLRAWKLEKARSLALKRAEGLADEANTAHKSLVALYDKRSGLTVSDTGRFSWLTVNQMDMMHQGRATPRLSEVQGVESPGHDFMRVVFNLEANGVGAALNQPQTAAYVVRVKSFSPKLELLHALFMSQRFDRYAQAGIDDQMQTFKVWREGIENEAQLVWKRPPDQPHARTAMK